MTEALTPAGYEQTKAKLANLEQRLSALLSRTDVSEQVREEARRSCERMLNQYSRELKLYEAAHREMTARH